jgi:hypothetical protein
LTQEVVETGLTRAHRVPGRPGRTFDDKAGLEWRVMEHQAGACRSLVFMSSSAMRRVVDFPDDWWLLSGRELEALSWRR